ncbi:MAG TPA: hypothetical protein VIG57_22100, partial [Candidatus Entotheonella sp.]
MKHAIWDVQRLLMLHDVIETLDLNAPPTGRVIFPVTIPPVRRVGLLCGSFNPLTLAHTELA